MYKRISNDIIESKNINDINKKSQYYTQHH